MDFYATQMMNAEQAFQMSIDSDIAKEEVLFATFNSAIREKSIQYITELDATLQWIKDRGGLIKMAELGFRIWKHEKKDNIFTISWTHKVKSKITIT